MKSFKIVPIFAAAALLLGCMSTGSGNMNAAGSAAGKVLYTTSFESGIGDWAPYGGTPTVEVSTDYAHTGTHSLMTSNREQTWNAPALNILKLTAAPGSYTVSAWVLVPKDSQISAVKLTVQTESGGNKNWLQIANPVETIPGQWVEVTGTYNSQSGQDAAILYVEPLEPQGTFYIDDVTIATAPDSGM